MCQCFQSGKQCFKLISIFPLIKGFRISWKIKHTGEALLKDKHEELRVKTAYLSWPCDFEGKVSEKRIIKFYKRCQSFNKTISILPGGHSVPFLPEGRKRRNVDVLSMKLKVEVLKLTSQNVMNDEVTRMTPGMTEKWAKVLFPEAVERVKITSLTYKLS